MNLISKDIFIKKQDFSFEDILLGVIKKILSKKDEKRQELLGKIDILADKIKQIQEKRKEIQGKYYINQDFANFIQNNYGIGTIDELGIVQKKEVETKAADPIKSEITGYATLAKEAEFAKEAINSSFSKIASEAQTSKTSESAEVAERLSDKGMVEALNYLKEMKIGGGGGGLNGEDGGGGQTLVEQIADQLQKSGKIAEIAKEAAMDVAVEARNNSSDVSSEINARVLNNSGTQETISDLLGGSSVVNEQGLLKGDAESVFGEKYIPLLGDEKSVNETIKHGDIKETKEDVAISKSVIGSRNLNMKDIEKLDAMTLLARKDTTLIDKDEEYEFKLHFGIYALVKILIFLVVIGGIGFAVYKIFYK